MQVFRRARARLLGLSDEEASFTRRGFAPGRTASRLWLERIGATVIHGYNAALHSADVAATTTELETCALELRGFAYEGAAMACALLDGLLPVRGGRWRRLHEAAGAAHGHLLHVGAGRALARLRRPLPRALGAFDPLLRSLVADGYGFHEGYFAPARVISEQAVPRRVQGYALRAFDQGLGRSLWFSGCAAPDVIVATIRAFAAERRPDLWSGVGLAAAYAGGCSERALHELREASGPHRLHLAQGVAFAVRARARSGNPAAHTDLACEVVAGASTGAVVAAVDVALQRATGYQAWRSGTRRLLSGEEAMA